MVGGEKERGVTAWTMDLYGNGEYLMRKREQRGWTEEEEKMVEDGWRKGGIEDVVLRMLKWKDAGIFDEILPWEDDLEKIRASLVVS